MLHGTSSVSGQILGAHWSSSWSFDEVVSAGVRMELSASLSCGASNREGVWFFSYIVFINPQMYIVQLHAISNSNNMIGKSNDPTQLSLSPWHGRTLCGIRYHPRSTLGLGRQENTPNCPLVLGFLRRLHGLKTLHSNLNLLRQERFEEGLHWEAL